jgi:hypothetical protein
MAASPMILFPCINTFFTANNFSCRSEALAVSVSWHHAASRKLHRRRRTSIF